MSKLQHQREQLQLQHEQQQKERIKSQQRAIQMENEMIFRAKKYAEDAERARKQQIEMHELAKQAAIEEERKLELRLEREVKLKMELKLAEDARKMAENARRAMEEKRNLELKLELKLEREAKLKMELKLAEDARKLAEDARKMAEDARRVMEEELRKKREVQLKREKKLKLEQDVAIDKYRHVQADILKILEENVQNKLRREKQERARQFKLAYSNEEILGAGMLEEYTMKLQQLNRVVEEAGAAIQLERDNQQCGVREKEDRHKEAMDKYHELQMNQLQVQIDDANRQFIKEREDADRHNTVNRQKYESTVSGLENEYIQKQECLRDSKSDISRIQEEETARQLDVKRQIEELQRRDLEMRNMVHEQLNQKWREELQLVQQIEGLDRERKQMVLSQQEEEVRFKREKVQIQHRQYQRVKQDKHQFLLKLDYDKTNMISQYQEEVQSLSKQCQSILRKLQDHAYIRKKEANKLQQDLQEKREFHASELKRIQNEFDGLEKAIQLKIDRRAIRDKAFKTYFSKSRDDTDADIIRSIKSKKIATITNVYQETYNDNGSRKNASGFGDFLRGCYFLMQVCDMIMCEYKILIIHPLSHYLQLFSIESGGAQRDVIRLITQNVDKFNDIVPFDKNNFSNDIDPITREISYIGSENISSEFLKYIEGRMVGVSAGLGSGLGSGLEEDCNPLILFGYTIAYPMNPIIPEKHKCFMREMLTPTVEMAEYVNNTLGTLDLVKGQYTVIHIRCGDKYLFGCNVLDGSDYDVDIDGVSKYLLISDNNQIKPIIQEKYGGCICSVVNEITHFGEGVKLDNEKVKNTMLDLFLIAGAKQIISYSVYEHGTGFSKWIAETYNIPYKCTYIDNK